MTNRDMLRIARGQAAQDIGCEAADFLSNKEARGNVMNIDAFLARSGKARQGDQQQVEGANHAI